MNERFEDLVRRPDAKVLGLGVGNRRLSPGVTAFSLSAGVPDGRLDDGVADARVEANRLRQHGVGPAELDRAKRWMSAFYSRALKERDKTESASYAREYVSHFLEGEPSPGIVYQYEMGRQFVPGDDDGGGFGAAQAAARRHEPRRACAVAAEARHSGAERDATCERRSPLPRRLRCRPGPTPPPPAR